MTVAEYRVVLTPYAKKLFTRIKDRREQQLLLSRMKKLKLEPDKQGKARSQKLVGYRSVRAVGQRYWIIYLIE